MGSYEENTKKDKRVALVAVAIYVIILVTAIFFVRISSDVIPKVDEEPLPEGIVMSFGDPDSGQEEVLPQKESAVVEVPVNDKSEVSVSDNSELTLNENTELPVNDNAKDAVIEVPSVPNVVIPKKIVNTKALYSAKKYTTEQTEQVATSQSGTKGSQLGSFDGSSTSVSLSGRSSIGSIPIPSYNSNKEGRVVIDIQVDKNGKVIKASFQAISSTTNDGKLVSEAVNAALKAKFNRDDNANFIQIGTITYIFKVQ